MLMELSFIVFILLTVIATAKVASWRHGVTLADRTVLWLAKLVSLEVFSSVATWHATKSSPGPCTSFSFGGAGKISPAESWLNLLDPRNFF